MDIHPWPTGEKTYKREGCLIVDEEGRVRRRDESVPADFAEAKTPSRVMKPGLTTGPEFGRIRYRIYAWPYRQLPIARPDPNGIILSFEEVFYSCLWVG